MLAISNNFEHGGYLCSLEGDHTQAFSTHIFTYACISYIYSAINVKWLANVFIATGGLTYVVFMIDD